MKSSYVPYGVCSSLIEFEVDDNNILKELRIEHGCNGNLKAISKLCAGKHIDEIISQLEGIKCGFKDTSCPDQIAKALIEYKKMKENN